MKLISLTCTNPKFKEIIFNDKLNIINGIQLSAQDKKTYNGIGKSCSLNLINLMLGAKPDSTQKFQKYLAEYGIFTLRFKHLENEYTVIKNFGEKDYSLNLEKLTYKKYISKLDQIFSSNNENLRFRQLFKAFFRIYGPSYYSDALTQQGMPLTDYLQRYVNFILLGIDTGLVEQKQKVKDQIEKLVEAEKTVKEYESKIDKINVQDKKDELEELYENKRSFVIAENYHSQKRYADQLTSQMNEFRESIFSNDRMIYIKSNELNSDELNEIDISQIREIYNEAEYFFPDNIYKRIEDVQEFHKKIIENRKKRIKKELEKLEAENILMKQNLLIKSEERDAIVKHLDNAGALEEYYALLDRIKEVENIIAEAGKYQDIINTFKKDKVRLGVVNSEIQEKGILYISNNSEKIEKIEHLFRSIVKRFYANSGGSFKLIETSDAKYLYDIKIEIPKEDSQGVGLVKIFCYDTLLFLLNKNRLGFMAHDGYLFSEMDPRQKAVIIKIVLELNEKYDLQYLINMNENTYNEIITSAIFSDAEKSSIKSSVILNLNDKPPKGWLFGEGF